MSHICASSSASSPPVAVRSRGVRLPVRDAQGARGKPVRLRLSRSRQELDRPPRQAARPTCCSCSPRPSPPPPPPSRPPHTTTTHTRSLGHGPRSHEYGPGRWCGCVVGRLPERVVVRSGPDAKRRTKPPPVARDATRHTSRTTRNATCGRGTAATSSCCCSSWRRASRRWCHVFGTTSGAATGRSPRRS